MPGYVESYVSELQPVRVASIDSAESYRETRAHLDRQLAAAFAKHDYSGPERDLDYERAVVQKIALEASKDVAKADVDTPGYPHTADRKAIMDWSHANNHALLEQIAAEYGRNAVENQAERKSANQLSNREIVAEVHELHSRFQELSREYMASAPTARADLRERMEPLVSREHELRREYTGRATPEIKEDRMPEQSIGYGR